MDEQANVAAASLRARIGGYVVDMVILSAIGMVVVVAAGAMLLFATDLGEQDATDPQYYAFFSMIGLGAPLIWTALNLALLSTRGQTGGQYVAGLRLRRADGGQLTRANVAAWWFSFNPLLFSWPMSLLVGFPLLVIAGLTQNRALLAAAFLAIGVCLIAPVAALVSVLFDRGRRGLHDRIAGTIAGAAG